MDNLPEGKEGQSTITNDGGLGGSIKVFPSGKAGPSPVINPYTNKPRFHFHTFRIIQKTFKESDGNYSYCERCRCGANAIVKLSTINPTQDQSRLITPKRSRIVFNAQGSIIHSSGEFSEQKQANNQQSDRDNNAT